jgi:hypothetical protein
VERIGPLPYFGRPAPDRTPIGPSGWHMMKGMWVVVEFVVLAAIILVAITEFFWPLMAGRPLFGTFRKKRPAPTPPTIEEELEIARRKAAEVRNVQRKTEEELRKAWDRKDEADDLLK